MLGSMCYDNVMKRGTTALAKSQGPLYCNRLTAIERNEI
jgi:hypothetical protein